MTVRDTLTRAARLVGGRPLGDTPSNEEMAAMLEDFQNMLMALPQTNLTDVLISANYTAGEWERITDTSGTATITRPTTITDSKTGQPRAPHNGAIVEVTSATAPTRHIYIAELKGWSQVNGLTLDSAQPFGSQHEEGVAAMLAVRVSVPVFRKDPSALVVALAENGRQSIRQRFRQPYTATTDPLLLNTFQRMGLSR